MLRDLDLPPLGGDGRGGPLVTKTLLFSAMSAGGSDGGPRLVAFDKATGDELGSVDLPRGAIGTPMTYLADGRQHIALTIGGNPPELISLALAREGIAREDVLGDGLYTEAQAERGAVVYERACLICHSTVPGEIIGQGAAPSLLGNAFSERWSGSPVSTLVEVIRQNVTASQHVVKTVVSELPQEPICSCASALENAIITSPDRIPQETKEKLAPILGKYLR